MSRELLINSRILRQSRRLKKLFSPLQETDHRLPTLDQLEWAYTLWVLRKCDGNRSQAARMLGLDRRTLQRKLAAHSGAGSSVG